MASLESPRSPAPNPSNRLRLDYEAEAARLPSLPTSIIDVHAHVNGVEAVEIYRRVTRLFNIGLTYTMTRLEEVAIVRDALHGRARFIAVPNYWDEENRVYHMGPGFIERIAAYHDLGARIVKFWAAPRATDYAIEMGDPDYLRIDAPHRIEAMEAASALGMVFMTHIADPDTWFAARYTDAGRYGTKAEQYEPFEELLDRFPQPWIAAHMGGWPEDLVFLDGLLERHSNLYLDTSATKWMVRELGRHSREDVAAFFGRHRGRILFGSDIVTTDEHLHGTAKANEMAAKAGDPREAFDLYASRYWVLRTMFETDHRGESPIADPDLAMVDPERRTEMDAPPLNGMALPPEIVRDLYFDAAHALLEPLHAAP